MLEGPDHHLGDERRLSDDQPGTDPAEGDDRHEEEACGAGVSQKAGIDRFHVKRVLQSRGVRFT
jgi:hypothetical protein